MKDMQRQTMLNYTDYPQVEALEAVVDGAVVELDHDAALVLAQSGTLLGVSNPHGDTGRS